MIVERSRIEFESKNGTLIGSASEMGLAPGTWPLEISVAGVVFQRSSQDRRGDEIMSVRYVTSTGRRLLILND